MTPLAAALAVALAACGGSGSQEDATADALRWRARIAVAVSPNADTLAPKATQKFAATVTNTANTAVVWSIQEGSAGGGVDSTGLYTAPSGAGTFHVVATSVANPNKSGTATVTVTAAAAIAVAVSPASASIATGASQQFSATVSGTTNGAVSWTVQEGAAGGAVSSTGLYTAPSTPGTYHVVATSQADGTRNAVATVTVSAPAVVSVTISPATAALSTGGTKQFSATVSGTTNGAVTWTVQEGATGGSVSSSGLYTAPSTPGTYHVVATSQADGTRSAAATVTVTAPVIAVAMSPTAATLAAGGTQQFSATVSGTTNATVTWIVQEGAAGGSVSSTGLYTAPTAAGTYHVVATSQADSTKSAVATVTVKAPSSTVLGDAPAWVSSLPTLSNGLPWNPGVPGGIPAGTLDTTLTTAQMTASAINSAISAASARGSPTNIRVVLMPAGTFSISGSILPQNYVVLRGAGAWGSGRTRINFGANGGVQNAELDWNATPAPANLAIAAGATLPVGSSQIPVSSATAFAVGDLVQIDQLDDLSYVAILDAGYEKRAPFTDGPYHGPISTGGLRSVGSQHVVTAVSGSTLTIDPPTRIEYTYYSKADGTTRLSPQVWRVARRGSGDGSLWYFGFEQASIAGPQNAAIYYHAGAYNWVKDVETDGSANGGISNDHVLFDHQFRSEIRRLYAHHTTGGPVQGGANYGIDLSTYTSDSLVIDSIATYMNKPVVTNCAGPGNVIAYNYVDNTSANGGAWMDGAIDGSHQSFTHNLLVEGNWTANMGTDATHGVSGFMAFVRNYSPGKSTNYANNSNLRCANADGWTREMAFLGNVLNPPSGAVYEATGSVVGGQYSVWSIGQNVWGDGGSWDTQNGGYNTVIGGVIYPPANAFSYGSFTDNRQAKFTTPAKSKLFRHGNWDSVHQSIYDWNASFPAHDVAASWFLTSAPAFFGANAWPWINPAGSTAAARVGTLPAKARYDAGTPFAP